MREILFRGKRVDNEKWVEGSLIFNPEYKYPFIGNEYLEYEEGMKVNVWREHYVIPETVGQFTGLTDKNGVKIFGDDLRKDIHGKIFRIYEMPGGFAIKDSYWASNISDLILTDILIMHGLTDAQTQSWIRNSTEAAGNIHDNPELLK